MSSVSQEEVADLIRANNQSLMGCFKELLSETVGEFKRSSEASSEQQMKEIKKLKLAEPRKFKRKANQDQFKFNQKVLETIGNNRVGAETSQLDKIRTELEEGENMLAERRKHVLLADKSEFGWTTVEEYKKHNLADDSEDEKRIFTVERRSRSSIATLKKKRSAPTTASKRYPPVRASTTAPAHTTPQHLSPQHAVLFLPRRQYGHLLCMWKARALARLMSYGQAAAHCAKMTRGPGQFRCSPSFP